MKKRINCLNQSVNGCVRRNSLSRLTALIRLRVVLGCQKDSKPTYATARTVKSLIMKRYAQRTLHGWSITMTEIVGQVQASAIGCANDRRRIIRKFNRYTRVMRFVPQRILLGASYRVGGSK
jgi:hypothetical protein